MLCALTTAGNQNIAKGQITNYYPDNPNIKNLQQENK